MTPILYKEDETDFYHKGIGPLGELTFVEVTEEENGDFSLELEYPTNGRYFNNLKEFMFIKAKPNSEDEPHIFRIYEVEKDTIGLTVTVSATSKTITDLQGNMVRKVNVNNETPQQAFNKMKNNLIYPTTYNFYSDITTTSTTEWIRRNPLSCIAGEEGSLLQYWGGEIKRGNQIISLLKRRGKDNVATIRYGKNLNGLVANFSFKGMVTRILPHFTYTPEGSKDEVTVEGSFVDSQYINNYPIPFIKEVDFSNDDDVKDLASLNKKAKEYFKENNGIDKPAITINIEIEDLFSTSEYSEKFKGLEKILLFDTVTVYHKKFDINITAKVNKLIYDPYREKNISLEVGSTRNTLLEDIKKDTQYQLNEVKKELNYVSLSADGKNRINYGSATPTIANKGDLWYKPNGEFTIMYIFDGAYWQPVLNTEELDNVSKEVEAVIADMAIEKEKINQTIAKADQAIADAGFIKLDLVQVKQDAVNAMTEAQQATGNVNTISTKVDTLTQTMILKADNTTVNNLTGVVDRHTLDIATNAREISLKLTSAQVDSLVTGKGYATTTALNATSTSLSASIVEVSTDLKNLEIGGRNLWNGSAYNQESVLNTYQTTGSFSQLSNVTIDTSLPENLDVEFTISFWAKSPNGITQLSIYNQNGNPRYFYFSKLLDNTLNVDWKYYTYTFTNIDRGMTFTSRYKNRIEFYAPGKAGVIIKNVKVEKGNKATDWTPAPEDMATVERAVAIEVNLNGLQTTVSNKAEQSQVTQLAGQISTKVESAEYNTKMTQLDSAINLRATKANLVSEINITPGVIRIAGKKIQLDGNVAMDTAYINKIQAIDISADRITAGTLNAANVNIINLNASKIAAGTITGARSEWNLGTGKFATTGTNNSLIELENGVLRSYSPDRKQYAFLNDAAIRFQANEGAAGQWVQISAYGTSYSSTAYQDIALFRTNIGLGLKPGENNSFSKNVVFSMYGVAPMIAFDVTDTSLNSLRTLSIQAEGVSLVATTADSFRINSTNWGYGRGTMEAGILKSNSSQNGSRLDIDGDVINRVGTGELFIQANQGLVLGNKARSARYNLELENLYSYGGGVSTRIAGNEWTIHNGSGSLFLTPSGAGQAVYAGTKVRGTYYPMGASNFVTVSQREFKDDIKPYENALSLLSTLQIRKYAKQGVDEIGLIVDEAPLQLVSADQLGISLYDFISLTAASTQQLSEITFRHECKLNKHEKEILELKEKIIKLESAA